MKEHVPKLKSHHAGEELWGVDIVSKGMQNFRWQWCVKEIYLEENSHSCLTGIGRQKKIIKPQCCLDDRLRCHCTEEESYCQHHWCCVGLTKIRARQTPAVTEITTQRRDLRLDSVIVELRRVPWDRERRLDQRSGVTRIFMSTVLKKKPRKTMERNCLSGRSGDRDQETTGQ